MNEKLTSDLEELRTREDLRLRQEALDLEREKFLHERQRKPGLSGIATAMVVGAVGIVGTFFGGFLNLDLESEKQEGALILEAIKTGDEEKAATNLLFLSDAELVKLTPGQLTALRDRAGEDALPVLPGATGPSRVPDQRVAFTAMSRDDFAIQSKFQGTAVVKGNELSVRVEQATISYSEGEGYQGARKIVSLWVSLVRLQEEGVVGAWELAKKVKKSRLLDVGLDVTPGRTIELDPFILEVSLQGLDSISDTWLAFHIQEKIPGKPEIGSSNAHSSQGQFSD